MNTLDRLIELAREASGEESPDVYRYLASEGMGVPYSEVTKEERAEAKRRFYHLLYSDYHSEGAFPAPTEQPSLEEIAEMVARFKAAFPELGKPVLVTTPPQRERPENLAGFFAPGYSVFMGDGTYLGRVDEHQGLSELLILKGREYPELLTGRGVLRIDTEMYLDQGSLNQKYPELFEQFRQLASQEVFIPEPAPATKMGAQSREPFWAPSWKRKR